MRYILFIAVVSLFTITTVEAVDNTCEEHNIAFMSAQDGGPVCGIGNGELKRALYQEPAPEKFTINASAYTAAADECGKSDGITASGRMVQENHTLACPREYAFGTQIHIEGMGTFICEDRGGAIKGNKFDIYMETKSEAFAFGRRNLVAYVVS
jgi:3D (Asp-Asp-Asp) domain-containing protein